MKADTIQVCIDALELAREFINAADDWNFDEAEINGEWIRNTRVFARIDQALADLEAATQAEPHAMPQDGAQWTPVEDGGLLAVVLKGLERYQRQIGRAELQGWYKTDVAQNEIARIDKLMDGLRGTDDQSPTLAICRRTPASPAPEGVTQPAVLEAMKYVYSKYMLSSSDKPLGDRHEYVDNMVVIGNYLDRVGAWSQRPPASQPQG